MNTASLKNCKRLYELSGWEDNDIGSRSYNGVKLSNGKVESITAYDAGYLLRRLPNGSITTPDMNQHGNSHWAEYCTTYPSESGLIKTHAGTPEDALCLLAIKLFEEGILKK